MILLGSAENGAVKKPDAPKAHPAECELLVGGKKILRCFAPQNDKDGGYPEQFKISVRVSSHVILSVSEGSSQYRQRKDSSSLRSSE